MSDKTPAIRHLNDRFRGGDTTIPGRLMFTRGLVDLIEETHKAPEDVIHLVRRFDAFSEDNDPYHQHDFGSFDFAGERCFWKIDYYSPDLRWGSEDPADPAQTIRVLTVLLASEY
jgi:hypothetical protein